MAGGSTGYYAYKYTISTGSILFDSSSTAIYGVYSEVVCSSFSSYCYFFGGNLASPTQGIIRFNASLAANSAASYDRYTPDLFSYTLDSAINDGTTTVVYGNNFRRVMDLSIINNPTVYFYLATTANERCYVFALDAVHYLVGEQNTTFSKYVITDSSLVGQLPITGMGGGDSINRIKNLHATQFAVLGTVLGFAVVNYSDMVVVTQEANTPNYWNSAFVPLPNQSKLIYITEFN